MRNRRNYYRVLQVQPDAPAEVIRASYRTLMRELKQHPDLGGTSGTAAVLNEAYEVLGDPARRSAYDRELCLRYTRRPSAGDVPGKRSPVRVLCPFCRRAVAQAVRAGDCCSFCRSPLESRPHTDPEEVQRRSLARIRRSGRILYYTAWPAQGNEAELVDLSLEGLRFVCSEKLKPGVSLKISAPRFEASARVTNARAEPGAGQQVYSIGVRFLAVNFGEARGTFVATSA